MSGEAGQTQLLLVHSVACLSLSVEIGLGVDEKRTPRRKPVKRHPSSASADPLPKITDELAGQGNMEGSHCVSKALSALQSSLLNYWN